MAEPLRKIYGVPEGARPFDRRDLALVCVFLILFVFSRVFWVENNLSAVTYWEDEYRWAAANELLSGPVHPLLEYQADHYQGGSLVLILTIVGLFRIFGVDPLVLKLAAILFGALTLSLLYGVGRAGFGRATAFWASLAYLVGPPLVAVSGLFVMGSHGESVIFSLLQILIFYRLLTSQGRTTGAWFAFGLVSGLGLWFCYTSGLSLVACGLTWLALEKPPRAREVGAAFVGGFVGLLPWFAYNVERSFVGLGRIAEVFGWSRAPDIWVPLSPSAKMTQLVFRDWVGGLLLPVPETWPAFGMEFALLLFAVPMAAALAASVARVLARLPLLRTPTPTDPATGAARREVVFLLYGLLWLLFYVGSRFTVDPYKGIHEYRLFLPVSVLLLLPAARSAALGLTRPGWVRAATATGVVAVVILSTWGTIAAVTRPMPPGAFRGAFGHMARGLLLHRKYETDLETAIGVAQQLRGPKERFAVFRGLGWGVAYRFEQDRKWESIHRAEAIMPVGARPAFRSGLRWASLTNARQLRGRLEAGTARPGSAELVEEFDELLIFAGGRPRAALPGGAAARPTPKRGP